MQPTDSDGQTGRQRRQRRQDVANCLPSPCVFSIMSVHHRGTCSTGILRATPDDSRGCSAPARLGHQKRAGKRSPALTCAGAQEHRSRLVAPGMPTQLAVPLSASPAGTRGPGAVFHHLLMQYLLADSQCIIPLVCLSVKQRRQGGCGKTRLVILRRSAAKQKNLCFVQLRPFACAQGDNYGICRRIVPHPRA